MPKTIKTGGVDLSQHEEITDITFAEKGAHLAVVHALQQPANGCPEPLMLKADTTDQELIKALEQVTVTLSMEEFLRKFMNMWYDDAELLTKLMGMKTEEEYLDEIEASGEVMPCSYSLKARMDKIEILEKTFEAEGDDMFMPLDKMSQDVREASVQALTELTKALSVGDNLSLFNDYVEKSNASSEASNEEALIKEASQPKTAPIKKEASIKGNTMPTKAKTNTTTESEVEVTKASDINIEELLKSDAVATHIQDLVKAATDKIEKAAQADLEKATTRIADLEKEKTERLEKAYTAMTDTFSYLDDETKPEVVKAVMAIKSTNPEASVTLISALEKAQEALKAAVETEVGFSGHQLEKSAHADLDAMIEAKYAKV